MDRGKPHPSLRDSNVSAVVPVGGDGVVLFGDGWGGVGVVGDGMMVPINC